MKKKYPNALQGDMGFYINLQVSGRRDKGPGVEIKGFDLVG
jgi:hypothetical protein